MDDGSCNASTHSARTLTTSPQMHVTASYFRPTHHHYHHQDRSHDEEPDLSRPPLHHYEVLCLTKRPRRFQYSFTPFMLRIMASQWISQLFSQSINSLQSIYMGSQSVKHPVSQIYMVLSTLVRSAYESERRERKRNSSSTIVYRVNLVMYFSFLFASS